MPNLWTFGGYDFAAAGCYLTQIDGYMALPPLRGEDILIPGLPGRSSAQPIDDSRRIALGVLVADNAGTESGTQALLQQLGAVFADRSTLKPLVNTRPDGTILTGQARCHDWTPVDVSRNQIGYTGVADFVLPDPYFYSGNVTASTLIPSSGSTQAITHPGTVRGHRMTLDLTGPITNPRVTNLGTGIYVEWLGVVPAASHLLIDCETGNATLGVGNVIGALRHAGAKQFLLLEPGVNSLSVTGSAMSSATRLLTTFRPPWI